MASKATPQAKGGYVRQNGAVLGRVKHAVSKVRERVRP